MRSAVYLNGRYCDSREALVSADDRGFLFGDGVYEAIRCYEGKLFKLEEHLLRLQHSAAKIMLELPHDAMEIAAVCRELLSRSGIRYGMIYLQVTRGAAPRTHQFPREVHPTFLAKIMEIDEAILQEHRRGVKAIFRPDDRWGHCDIKSVSLLPNVLAREAAARQGAYEAIFVHDLGITECGSSNLFILRKGTLITAPEGNHILSGIMRETVIELAAEAEVPVVLRYPGKAEVITADEVFITNSIDEIAPVLAIDEKMVAGGKPGRITLLLQEMLEQLKQSI